MKMNNIMKPCTCRVNATVSANLQVTNTRRAAACRLLDTIHSLGRAGRALMPSVHCTHDEFDLVALSRICDRTDGIARLLSKATEDLRLLGVGKNDPLIEIDGKWIGFQKASRRLREIRVELGKELAAMETRIQAAAAAAPAAAASATLSAALAAVAAAAAAFVGKWIAEKFLELFNDTDDDDARNRVSKASHDEIRGMSEDELVAMINAMLDGPTGDDDEAAILKILEASDCGRRVRIVDRVGLDELLYNVDGSEWDRLVILLTDCGIIGFDSMDDDASRLFVNTRSCSQLGQLTMSSVRQLVLNMFSGSCGDDDEDAILKLLRCQSRSRLHQLVGMPGTGVDRFDYNFDGDQWDDLEDFFAANGITLDP